MKTTIQLFESLKNDNRVWKSAFEVEANDRRGFIEKLKLNFDVYAIEAESNGTMDIVNVRAYILA